MLIVSNIFSMYQSLIFVCGSLLIVFAKVITRILVADSFYPSWQYMPTLILSTALSCFVTFLGTIYVVEKKSNHALIDTLLGTIFNVIGNFFLIRAFGVQGAAISTAASYGFVFLLRAFKTRRYIPIDWDLPRFGISMTVMIAQCVIMITEIPYWIPIEAALSAVLVAIHFRPLLNSAKHILRRGG